MSRSLERGAIDVLVPAAHAMGGLGVIRSLGVAGYRVHAAAASDAAIGLASAYATERVVHPPLTDAFFGHPVDTVVTGRNDVLCRNTIPFEVAYLASLLRDREVSAATKFRALAESVALTLDPRVRNDLWFPGDRRLYLRRLGDFARQLIGRVRET